MCTTPHTTKVQNTGEQSAETVVPTRPLFRIRLCLVVPWCHLWRGGAPLGVCVVDRMMTRQEIFFIPHIFNFIPWNSPQMIDLRSLALHRLPVSTIPLKVTPFGLLVMLFKAIQHRDILFSSLISFKDGAIIRYYTPITTPLSGHSPQPQASLMMIPPPNLFRT